MLKIPAKQALGLSRVPIVLIALGLAVAIVAIGSASLTGGSYVASFLFDMAASEQAHYPFTIQNLMWLMFFLGLGELTFRHNQARGFEHELAQKLLPEQDEVVLQSSDLGSIYRTVHSRSGLLAGLIKSLVLRFQAGHSVEQTHQMLNSQLEMQQFKMELDYNMLRYLSWLIPTLGFIGTVVGIANALNYAGIPGKATDPAFVSELTQQLAVAFYTTLLALIMSAVLVFATHVIQGREEGLIIKCGQYCLDNFVNRLFCPR